MPRRTHFAGQLALLLLAAAPGLNGALAAQPHARQCDAMLGSYSVAPFTSPAGLALLALAIVHRDYQIGTPAFRVENEDGRVKHWAPLSRSVSPVELTTPAQDARGAVFAALPARFVTCSYMLGDNPDRRVIQVDWSAMSRQQLARFAEEVGQGWEAVVADMGRRPPEPPPGTAPDPGRTLDAKTITSIRYFISLPIPPEGADRRLVFLPLNKP